LSITEAEYIALSDAVNEVIWLCHLLRELEAREVHRLTLDLRMHYEDEISK